MFIRSTAAGDRLGGLAPATRAAASALAVAFDMVVIETVGVGQSETEVAEVADTTVVVVQPGSGDVLQFLKAGIMEVPDVLVVTKADLGRVATRALADLRAALRSLGGADTEVVSVSSIAPASGITSWPTRLTPTGPVSTCRSGALKPAACTRWPTSRPHTETAGCARSEAGGRLSGGWPSRIQGLTCPHCSAPLSSAPAHLIRSSTRLPSIPPGDRRWLSIFGRGSDLKAEYRRFQCFTRFRSDGRPSSWLSLLC